MSPVSLVFHTMVMWDWSEKCLSHNKFSHRNKRTLTLASPFKKFLWEQAWIGIQFKDAVLCVAKIQHEVWNVIHDLNDVMEVGKTSSNFVTE